MNEVSMKKITYTSLIGITLLVLFAFLVAVPKQWEIVFPTWDTYFHFIGGFFATLLAVSYYSSEFKKLSQPFAWFTLLGIALGIGVFWEFFEYLLNVFFSTSISQWLGFHVSFQGNLDDTIKDLAMDTTGAIAAGVIFFRTLRK